MFFAWVASLFGKNAADQLGYTGTVPVVMTPQFWERMTAGIAGAVLILVGLGIIMYSNPQTRRVVDGAASVATTVATKGVIK